MKTEANATKETDSKSKHAVWWFVNSQRAHWIPTNADSGRRYDFDIPARRVSILKSSSHCGMDVSCFQANVHIRHRVQYRPVSGSDSRAVYWNGFVSERATGRGLLAERVVLV
jgi:hypothetical protein